eukprot:TRINITY_DN8605_c3_g1_i1.p2 TRINITY_DN8605_c3_g1~~TRINITY_DN8605_c3_g1_i1.p2  ORF type:complete len:200 (-),score=-3.49 TRINITY_DN8605_c3_g1_i1:579-1178(-)
MVVAYYNTNFCLLNIFYVYSFLGGIVMCGRQAVMCQRHKTTNPPSMHTYETPNNLLTRVYNYTNILKIKIIKKITQIFQKLKQLKYNEQYVPKLRFLPPVFQDIYIIHKILDIYITVKYQYQWYGNYQQQTIIMTTIITNIGINYVDEYVLGVFPSIVRYFQEIAAFYQNYVNGCLKHMQSCFVALHAQSTWQILQTIG